MRWLSAGGSSRDSLQGADRLLDGADRLLGGADGLFLFGRVHASRAMWTKHQFGMMQLLCDTWHVVVFSSFFFFLHSLMGD